jgi:hypothetical protein
MIDQLDSWTPLRCRAAQISGRRSSDHPTKSINEDERHCILCGFDYILKLPVGGGGRVELG